MEKINNKKLLILDMNSTFMFDEDRFSESIDYSKYYKSIGGTYNEKVVNNIITLAYNYLDERYSQEKYMEDFPSLEEAIQNVSDIKNSTELAKIIDTFAFFERGKISGEYIQCLNKLSQQFTLSAIIDIWAPSYSWIELFKQLDIYKLFSYISFSSDTNIVKPSPIPFKNTLEILNIEAKDALMVGDSIQRDLGGANNAGIDCIIVGDQTPKALACYDNLLEFERSLHFNIK